MPYQSGAVPVGDVAELRRQGLNVRNHWEVLAAGLVVALTHPCRKMSSLAEVELRL